MKMNLQTKPGKEIYSRRNVQEFLFREFANDQVMRWRLTNLIEGIRQAEYERGLAARVKKAQTERQVE